LIVSFAKDDPGGGEWLSATPSPGVYGALDGRRGPHPALRATFPSGEGKGASKDAQRSPRSKAEDSVLIYENINPAASS